MPIESYEDDEEEQEGPKSSFATYLAEGDTLFKQSEFKKALDSYSLALELQPNDKICLVARSKCHLKLGDPQKALLDAEAALTEDKEFNKGLYRKAEALYCMGDFEYALMYYHRGHKLRPELDEFRLGIQKAQEAIDNSIGSAAKIKLENKGDLSFFTKQDDLGNKKRGYGKPNRGNTKLKPTIPNRNKEIKPPAPSKKTVKQLLGELYADKEYLEQLMEDTDYIESNVNQPIYELVQSGINYLDTRTEFWRQQKPLYARQKDKVSKKRKGKPSMAKYVLKELEEIDQALINGNPDRSLKLAQQLLKKVEDSNIHDLPNKSDVMGNVHSCIGNAFVELELLNKALKHHQKDVEISKKSKSQDGISRSLDNIGRVYARMGKYDKAVKSWTEKLPLIKTPLESTWLSHEIGRCYLELGKFGKAEEFGEKSFAAGEECQDEVWQLNASVLIAQAQVKLGKLESSLKSFNEAYELALSLDDESAQMAIIKATEEVQRKIQDDTRPSIDLTTTQGEETTQSETEQSNHADEATQSDTEQSNHPDETTQSDTEQSNHADETTQSDTEQSNHADETTQSDTEQSNHADETTQSDTEQSNHADETTQSDTDQSNHPDETTQSDTEQSFHGDEKTQSDNEKSNHADEATQSDTEQSSHGDDKTDDNNETTNDERETTPTQSEEDTPRHEDTTNNTGGTDLQHGDTTPREKNDATLHDEAIPLETTDESSHLNTDNDTHDVKTDKEIASNTDTSTPRNGSTGDISHHQTDEDKSQHLAKEEDTLGSPKDKSNEKAINDVTEENNSDVAEVAPVRHIDDGTEETSASRNDELDNNDEETSQNSETPHDNNDESALPIATKHSSQEDDKLLEGSKDMLQEDSENTIARDTEEAPSNVEKEKEEIEKSLESSTLEKNEEEEKSLDQTYGDATFESDEDDAIPTNKTEEDVTRDSLEELPRDQNTDEKEAVDEISGNESLLASSPIPGEQSAEKIIHAEINEDNNDEVNENKDTKPLNEVETNEGNKNENNVDDKDIDNDTKTVVNDGRNIDIDAKKIDDDAKKIDIDVDSHGVKASTDSNIETAKEVDNLEKNLDEKKVVETPDEVSKDNTENIINETHSSTDNNKDEVATHPTSRESPLPANTEENIKETNEKENIEEKNEKENIEETKEKEIIEETKENIEETKEKDGIVKWENVRKEGDSDEE